jgi:glutamyl-tRNA reductase
MIEAGALEYMRRLRELDAVDTLTLLRRTAHDMAAQELEKAQRLLANGKPAEEVLRRLAHGLTNKLLHQPTVQLRRASADGRDDLLQLVQELYQLTPPDNSSS